MSRRLLCSAMLIVFLLAAGCGGPASTPAQGPAPTAPAQAGAATAAPTAAKATVPTAGTSAPAQPTAPAVSGGRTLTVMTHDSFSASQEVVAKFEAQCGCKVSFLKSGDAGLALNKAILSKGNPLADAFYGVDNTFLSRALSADVFEPYASPALAGIAGDLKVDASNRLLPVDYGYVNLNYDKKYLDDHKLAPPQNLRELTDPRYKGLLVVENPATSSPGLAFLLTTISVFGESGSYSYLNYWRDLRANGVLVVDGWDQAYNTNFSAGPGKGDRPLVVSYATSPAAEVYYGTPPPADAPTGNVLPAGQTFRQIEFVGVLKGAKNPDLARQWIDFMLGESFQADIPLQMWVYPARTGTPLPDVFTRFAQVPNQPAALTPDQIEAGRDKWIQAWTEATLR